jgi:hypothetical protein
MKTDELLNMIEKSYNESAYSLFKIADNLIPVLLLLREVAQDSPDSGLFVESQGKQVEYCSVTNAIGEILSGFPERLYEARNEMDEKSTMVSIAIHKYRELQRTKPTPSQ